MKRTLFSKLAYTTSLLTVSFAGRAFGQDTTFTYQGRLEAANVPANFDHGFLVRLFDAEGGGNQIGSTVCKEFVEVVNGLFTLELDFGSAVGSESPRFLDIQVKENGNCSDTSGYTQLLPRQRLTATPRAVHALGCVEAESASFATLATAARRLDAPDGSPTNAVFVDNAGKVGIGTTAPTHTVHIAAAEPTLTLQDKDSTTQQAGYISYRDSGNVERAWVGYGTAGSPHFSIVNARTGGNIELTPFGGGKVTIGSHFATAGDENLRIIRGTVNANGTLNRGLGFTVAKAGTGDYLITFVPPFSDAPSMTASWEFSLNTSPLVVSVDNVTVSTARVVSQFDLDSFFDQPFHFIAIGPR